MAFSKIFYLVLPLLLLVLAKKVVSQGGDTTTTFIYDSFSKNINTLLYQGDAFVPPSSSFVRLTKTDSSGQPETNSIGRLVYAKPVMFWDEGLQASFETTIKFVVNPSTNPAAAGVGDGFNFFMVPVGSTIPPGSVDGDLGLFDPQTGNASSVFAVEFDIAPNHAWDTKYDHIGIDINSRVSRKVGEFKNSVGKEVTARITYEHRFRTVTVVATYGSVNSTVSYYINLKTILPKRVNIGISATTGSWVAFHDLHSWQFASSLLMDGNNFDKTYII